MAAHPDGEGRYIVMAEMPDGKIYKSTYDDYAESFNKYQAIRDFKNAYWYDTEEQEGLYCTFNGKYLENGVM